MKNTMFGFFLLLIIAPLLWFALHPSQVEDKEPRTDSSKSEFETFDFSDSPWLSLNRLANRRLKSLDSLKLDSLLRISQPSNRRDSLLVGLYAFAQSFKEEQLYLQSRIFYEKALSVDMNFSCLRRRELGGVYLKLGYPDKAMSLNESCLKQVHSREEMFWAANLYFALGKLKTSRQILNQIERQESLRPAEKELLEDLRKKLNDDKILLLE